MTGTRAAVVVLGGLAALAPLGCGRASAPERASGGAASATAGKLVVPRPQRLGPQRATTSRWAPVRRRTVVRAAPSGAGLATLRTRTPERTRNIVQADRSRVANGRVWVRVRLAALPNGRSGWVPRRALGGYRTVDTRLVIDRRRLTAVLFRGRRAVFSSPVGVGEPATPTPAGRFYVRNKLTRYRSARYGPVAFGTSGRSPVLTDWPAGGFVGIHGTDRPELLPGRVSHGCVRMANDAIRRLERLMPVGTTVVVT